VARVFLISSGFAEHAHRAAARAETQWWGWPFGFAGWALLAHAAFYSIPQLRLINLTVNRAAVDQFAVRAFRGDLAVVQHQDLVGLQHGADALGDDESWCGRA
jgi:hypothetical protein